MQCEQPAQQMAGDYLKWWCCPYTPPALVAGWPASLFHVEDLASVMDAIPVRRYGSLSRMALRKSSQPG